MKLYDISEPGQSPVPHQNDDQIVIGIDLGTTNSLVAFTENNFTQIIGDLLPSKIYFDNQGNICNQQQHKFYTSSFKRLIGKKYDDIADKSDQIVNHYNGLACIKIANKIYTSIELSAQILITLKQRAEHALGKNISKAVITVPAYFNDLERQATKEAAIMAGLDVMRLINEPTAAALAYGLDNNINGNFIIYDLGGGTFDISILNLHNKIFQVVVTKGDTSLGGDDFDQTIAKYLKANFNALESFQQLQVIAKNLKEQLTNAEQAEYNDYKITKSKFNQLTANLVDKTIKLIHQAINESSFDEDQINGIVLVGGSTRMPIISQILQENFSIPIFNNLNPDEIVAIGAALQANNLHRGSDHLLIDVLPLSIGIELMGGIVERIVPRNTTIPTSITQEFTTYQDNQTGMIFNIVQGERDLAKDCRNLGKFEIKGIPTMVAGMAKIKMKFIIDADGLLTVDAEETATQTKQTIHINPSFGLSREHIREMLMDSIEHSQQDMNYKQLIEARIEANRLLYTVENIFNEAKFKLPAVDLEAITNDMAQLKVVIAEDNRDNIINQTHQLEKSSNILAEYKFSNDFSNLLKGKSLDDLSKMI